MIMTVRVLAFGVAKDIFGASSANIELPSNAATAAGLKTLLEEKYPRLQQLKSFMLAVNNEFASGGEVIGVDDEIAVIPPVSGG
jgi:molybdopterin synthase sulfur carrier subunit